MSLKRFKKEIQIATKSEHGVAWSASDASGARLAAKPH